MSETTATSTNATGAGDGESGAPRTGAGGNGDGTDTRLARVESAVERIENTLARLVPTSHRQAEQRVEGRLDRPSSVEEQVRAELARAKAEQEQAAAADADKAERETTAQRLAKLEERPPEPPVKRATKMLGWGSR